MTTGDEARQMVEAARIAGRAEGLRWAAEILESPEALRLTIEILRDLALEDEAAALEMVADLRREDGGAGDEGAGD